MIKFNTRIVLISETWWTDESVTIIPGYNLFRKDREHGKGGGVCIYIDEKIKAYEIYDICPVELKSEQVWCVVEIGVEKILIGCVYRKGSTTSEYNSHLINSIKNAYDKYSKNKCTGILICGDFNFTTINWSESLNEIVKESDNQASLFIECLEDCFMHQNVFNPTFQIKTGQDSNVFDLIFVIKVLLTLDLEPHYVMVLYLESIT